MMKLVCFVSLILAFAAAQPVLPAFAASSLDEGEWPPVLTEFKTPSLRTVKGAYFRGRMIRSSKDGKSAGSREFLLRRSVFLKAKPVEAWIQFTGVRLATLMLNGETVAHNPNWMRPMVKEVGGYLKEGANEIGFACTMGAASGGVLAELFVRYPDGTHERIDTDSSFSASCDGGKTWENAIEQIPPPALPWAWVHRLAYIDFAHLQRFVSGAMEPGKAVAGDKVAVRMQFNGPVPVMPLELGIEIRRGDSVYWREDVTIGKECLKIGKNGDWSLRFPFGLPEYISDGKFDFVVASGVSCVSGIVAKAAFVCHRAAMPEKFAAPPCADVRMVAGAPQFHIGGKPFFALLSRVGGQRRPDGTTRHSSAPLSVVTVDASHEEWWPSTDVFDPAVFDRQAERARRDNGENAYFMYDIQLYPPRDWEKANPDELCKDNTGEITPPGRVPFSLASKTALDAMERALVKALGHLESAPYANRIIGYRINSGYYTEWMGWFPKPGRHIDFSTPSKVAFAEYVKVNHPEWSDASIPSAEERVSSDPTARARTAAFYDFYSKLIADDIIRMMRKARGIVGNGKLLGTYYGYVMTCNGSGRGQMRSHYALKHLLNAGVVDFLMSPQNYTERRLGGICCDMKPFATLAANGVVPMIENDARTSNGPFNGNNWQTHTLEQTIGIVRRDAGTVLCRRQPVFFFAIREGTEFDFPEFADDMAVVRKVGEHCIAEGVGRRAEVAYVVSEEAIKFTQPLKRTARPTGAIRQLYRSDGSVDTEKVGRIPNFGDSFKLNYVTLMRAGAPVDYVLAEDLADHPGNYKLYIEPDILAGKVRFRTASGTTELDSLLKIDDLRNMYARAGVHVYTDTADPMEANDRLVMLHARFAGRKTVKLPKRATVLDVFNRRIVAKDAEEFSFEAPLHSSWLFYCGDDAEALAKSLDCR